MSDTLVVTVDLDPKVSRQPPRAASLHSACSVTFVGLDGDDDRDNRPWALATGDANGAVTAGGMIGRLGLTAGGATLRAGSREETSNDDASPHSASVSQLSVAEGAGAGRVVRTRSVVDPEEGEPSHLLDLGSDCLFAIVDGCPVLAEAPPADLVLTTKFAVGNAVTATMTGTVGATDSDRDSLAHTLENDAVGEFASASETSVHMRVFDQELATKRPPLTR